MAMLDRRKALGFKLEAVSGTPETIAAADVVLAEEGSLEFSPEVEEHEVKNYLATLSQNVPIAGRTIGKLKWKSKGYGSSAAGVAPFWGKCLQPAGFAETVVGGTSVKYLPASTAIKSATLKSFMDGISGRLHAARADSVGCEHQAGGPDVFSFSYIGLWEPRTYADAIKDEALLEGSSFPAFDPKVFRSANFKLDDTYSAIMEKINWTLTNTIARVPDANVTDYKRLDIVARALAGTFDAEAVTKATYDFYLKFVNKTPIGLKWYSGVDDTGTGTGALNSLTDATKGWIVNQWNTYSVEDSAGAVFAITANTATALTVAGTPATGAYRIYQPGKMTRTSIPKAVLGSVDEQNKNGIYNFGLPFKAGKNAAAGDDEIEIFCK